MKPDALPPSEELEVEYGTTFVRAREMAARILSRIRRGRTELPQETHHAPRVFADGEEVAGRYQVVRFLGRGGAGQVFEVDDRELDERVALKTLHPRHASSPDAIERFKQEVLLARSVTHENVCRLFDFGRHVVESDEQVEPVYFVTMELLPGETVSERVRRHGAFAPREALAIAQDVAVALSAAHRQGVIHRDINGSNVQLAPRPDGTIRTVVTDFGLALAEEEDGNAVPFSSPKLEGTPLFMAPEQVRGGRVTKATDVYAFGVLLFHMLTGRWPFVGDTAVATALARIDAEPAPPSRWVAGLDPAVDALVLRCLEREPAARWPSFEAIVAEIEARNTVPPPRPSRAKVPPSRVILTIAALLLTLALLGMVVVGALRWQRKMNTSASPTAVAKAVVPARPVLVVLGFSNETGRRDLAWVATALTEGLTSTLAAGERALLVDGTEADRVRSDLALADRGTLSPRDLARIGQRSGAGWAVAGAYHLAAGDTEDVEVDLELRLMRTDGETSPEPLYLHASLAEVPALATRSAASVLPLVGIAEPTRSELETARTEQPGQVEAARYYAEGLAALRRFEIPAARKSFERAAEVEPDHPLIQLSLAEVWSELGYRDHAKQSAERAFDHAQSLSREKQLAVEARYRLTVHDWQRAEELYRALREFFPDDLDYGLALAKAQDKGARLDAAFQTLAELRTLPAPWGDDPRIDLTEALVAYHHGDYARSQAAAGRAAKLGRDSGSTSLVAQALETDALTRVHTDPTLERVTELLAEAQTLFASVGHQSGLTRVRFALGSQAFRRGELTRAEQHYREGLALAAETGSEGDLAKGTTSLAMVLDRQGHLADGLALKQEILANYRRRDVKQGAAIMLENLGISLLKIGRPREAMVRLQEAGAAFEAVGDTIGVAWVPYYQGRVWLDLGELDLARRSFDRALVNATDHPAGGLDPHTRFELARIELASGQLAAAERHATDLIKAFGDHDQPASAAETQILLARILATKGAWSQAAELASAARTTLDGEGEAPLAAAAAIVLTRASLASKSLRFDPVCSDLSQRLESLETMDVVLRGRVVLARCSWRLASRPTTNIRMEVERIVAEARDLGLFEAALWAGQLHAELLAALGDDARGRAVGDALRQEARELGWADIAWIDGAKLDPGPAL